MSNQKRIQILEFIREKQPIPASEIYAEFNMGESTIRKYLKHLVDDNLAITIGTGKATRYSISPNYELLAPIDMVEYYEKDEDEREGKESFNHDLISDVLQDAVLFTKEELDQLKALQAKYTKSVESVDEDIYKKRMEVFAIDLIWKSSEIEGNTYSLLETEALIKQMELAEGKSKEEAIMLLNHKKALDFITADLDYLKTITLQKTITIHTLLTTDLGINQNIRQTGVGITGTKYKPLALETQIMEALEQTNNLVNSKKNIFEKALLLLALVSYIQAFNDGNKRTARILSNALLLSEGYCPLSFRTVKSVDYKKAMLLFYEQNNISELKKMFIE
ncbi:MAG: Fic family protein, partial [Candidatus Heimdallarchaeota archaeon]